MQTTRRKLLGTMAAVTAVGVGATQVMGADGEEPSISIDEINEEREYVVFRNIEDSEADLSGYIVDFEYNGEEDQTYELPEGSTVPTDETFVVATGAKDVPNANASAGSGRHFLHNERTDVVALLTPEEDVVVTSEETPETTTTEETTTSEETTTEDGGDESGDETTTEEDSDETTTDEDGNVSEDESDDSTDDSTEETSEDESAEEAEDDC